LKSWTKNEALIELNLLIQNIDNLYKEQSRSEKHTRWSMRVFRFIEEVFGRNSNQYRVFSSLRWPYIRTLPFALLLDGIEQAEVERTNQQEYIKQLETAKGLLEDAKDELESSDIDSIYQGKDTAPEASAILKIINIAEHKLRKAIQNAPSVEKEIQNAFETLLIGADIFCSREKDSIEYSTKTYIPDFIIPKIDLAIEIKFCGKNGREKDIIEEINDDILAYQTKYGNILFVIYDIGNIRDVDSFVKPFEENQGVVVKVVKH